METDQKINQADAGQTARDILSDVTVFMKYARHLPELERRETWDELVDRNVNMHVKKFPELEGEIRRVYDDFVRPKKVLPSMRSLQFAGPAVEVNNIRMYNCLGRETAFITSGGTKTFADFEDGDSVRVLSHRGVWRNAVVRNYGKQELHTLTFVRGEKRTSLRATKNHRWIKSNLERTTSLEVGDELLAPPPWFSGFSYQRASPIERLYWSDGFMYGGGFQARAEGETYLMAHLQDIELIPRFRELGFFVTGNSVSTNSYLGTLPELGKDSPELIRAFVHGYLDARNKIRSRDRKFLELLPVAGMFASAFAGALHDVNDNHSWRLHHVSDGIDVEDVWCLEVEHDASFVLDEGLVTGNCSYLPIKDVEAFQEIMFLLLSGTGVGYSVQKHHVEQLPPVKKPTKTRRYLVGDSIVGWADAVGTLMRAYLDPSKITRPIFDYRDIRPKGHRLVTSGGKAPGPEPLRICLTKMEAILLEKEPGTQLTTLEAHDLACHIADAVLSGGIRRAAMISLFSYGDWAMASCKSGAWYELNPQRGRANNSAVLLRHRVTRESFNELWGYMKASGAGEPGLFFSHDREVGVNPCGEISLKPYGLCNLTEINASNVASQEDFNERARAASFIGTLQAAYTDFYYLRDEWKETAEREALLGVSMTGIASGVVESLNMREAAEEAVRENERMAGILGINRARRITTVKPSGTTSLVLGTSSGVHAWHNDYYIRRIRVNKNEAIYTYLKIYHPELLEDEFFSPETTAVISIPQKAPDGATILRNETAVGLLERVKKLHEEWIRPGHRHGDNTHNVSCTVSIKSREWDEVRDYIWNNRDALTAVSCLPHNDHTYVQAPFEDCSKEVYERMVESLSMVDLTKVLEPEDNTGLLESLACQGGGCTI